MIVTICGLEDVGQLAEDNCIEVVREGLVLFEEGVQVAGGDQL